MDSLQFQIVTAPSLKHYCEMGKRIQQVWEIYFHLLVRISICFMGKAERKETTIGMCVSKKEIRKDQVKIRVSGKSTNPYSVFLCRDADLNCGHGDFQSPALPTELSRLTVLSSVKK